MDVSTATAQLLVRVGKRIDEAIARQGLSHAKFARQLKMDAKNLRRILQGKQNLTFDTAMKVATALGISFQDLVA